MADAKKVVIGIIIAILFAVLVFSVIEAVYPRPQHEDFCRQEARPAPFASKTSNCTDFNVPTKFQEDCIDKGGYVDYSYDNEGCISDYSCNTCQKELSEAEDKHDLYVFYISAALSLIAIFIALYMPFRKEPSKKDNKKTERSELDEWIATGFLLGGAFALFFGTATSYSALDRITRPIVILLEIILVIFISYKKFGKK